MVRKSSSGRSQKGGKGGGKKNPKTVGIPPVGTLRPKRKKTAANRKARKKSS